jgi:two-component system, OmpR family, sensor kinase
MVLLAMGLAAWASHRALAPVADMARVAEEWSEHDLERRFDLGPPTNEIRALGHTMDALLDKVARAITAEQRLTAELAHELRSPLTTVQATAELVAMRADLDPQLRQDISDISAACRTMADTIATLLDLARSPGAVLDRGASCEVRAVLEELRREVSARPDVDAVVEVDAPTGLLAATSRELLRRAIVPVLENAVDAATRVRLVAVARERTVRITIADDGPGVAAASADRLFEPGYSTRGSSGLGLALARRVAHGAGGDLLLRDPATPGAVFELVLPRA